MAFLPLFCQMSLTVHHFLRPFINSLVSKIVLRLGVIDCFITYCISLPLVLLTVWRFDGCQYYFNHLNFTQC